LPRRPTPQDLVAHATTQHAKRLRQEILTKAAPVLITFGEEARQVIVAIADDADGPPTKKLRPAERPVPGTALFEESELTWLALVHPGYRGNQWVTAISEGILTLLS
jgi:uracil-DNA glycosylase